MIKYRIWDGTPWKIEVLTDTDLATDMGCRNAVAAVQQWKKFGIDAEVLPSEARGDLYNTGDFEVSSDWPAQEPWGAGPDLYRVLDHWNSAYIRPIGEVPAGHPGEDAGLFEAVKAVGMQLCPQLDITIPVGKDSMSMKTVWQEGDQIKEVTAPLSLVISAFAEVTDVRKTLTPQLRTDKGDTDLLLIDLGKGHNRLGASALAQVYKQIGHHAPDLDDPQAFKAFFELIQELNQAGLLLAYHDRSDGGLFASLCEMAFAGHCGISIHLDDLGDDIHAALFSEELGAVIQVRHCDTDEVMKAVHDAGLGHHTHVVGTLNDTDQMEFSYAHKSVLSAPRTDYHQAWSETSLHMQKLRDNPECAQQ